jgi:hypothetical protein
MKPITFSLQFRGQAEELDGGLRKQGRAPGCALVTSLSHQGLVASFVWGPGEEEAFFESTLSFIDGDGFDEHGFDEHGAIFFSPGHRLRVQGKGRLGPSPDPHLRHGTVVWTVVEGEGQFADASGRITSNFFVSDSGDLTENQLGVVFVNDPRRAP